MRALPSGTVTFMFTDIEGSTELLTRMGQEAYARSLDEHTGIIRHSVAVNDGVEVRTEGDAVFAVFSSTESAVRAAIAAQTGLGSHNWAGGTEFKVRMGLHTGAGILGGDDYVGIDVNRAARISDAGHGGQILLSSTTAAIAADTLDPGVEIIDLGSHQLRGIGPERIHQVVFPGGEKDFPSLRTPGASAVVLPDQLTSFVGRDTEIDEISRALEDRRLITLTGPGGTGKTRLSIAAASRVVDRFPDGVFFVPLADTADPESVPSAIVGVLGLRTNSAQITPTEQLTSYLAPRKALMILDNFEHVLDSAEVVSRIVRSGEEVRVLVTSRVPLHVSGEQEYPVAPLSIDSGHNGSITDSMRLFIDRALTIDPAFDESNLEPVAQLTSRLDGLPLAIELAASRVKVLAPAQILERLDNRLLADPTSDLPSRQKTIAGTIAWSYDFLDVAPRKLFERFSVFSGGCTLPFVERVCDDPEGSGMVLDDLGTLVDHSLLRRVEDRAESRFHMLRVIREYAQERLEAADAEIYRRRHAEAYRDLVLEAQPHLLKRRRAEWLERLATEHDNIRSALDWALDGGDADLALDMASGMWRFWQTRGPLPEALDRVGRALDLPGGRPIQRGRALEAAGGIAYWIGDFESMAGHYEEALTLMREWGDPPELAEALYNLSFAYAATREFETALGLLEESQAVSEEAGNALGIAKAFWGRFNVAWYEGDVEPALHEALAAVEQFEKLDALYDLGWANFAVGDSLIKTGDLAGARSYFDRALPDFLQAGDLSALILFFIDYAALAVLEGQRERAARLLGAAQALKEQTGATLWDAQVWLKPNKDIRDILGVVDDSSAAYLEAGRAMTAEEAVDYALSGTE